MKTTFNDKNFGKLTDREFLRSVSERLDRLFGEFVRTSPEKRLAIFRFNYPAWNTFGNAAEYRFVKRIEIH